MRDLNGKIALVTGAASGIGRALAVELVRHGSSLVILDRDESGLSQTQKLIEKAGGKVHSVVFDLSDLDGIPQMLDQVQSEFGLIDLLINNAGFTIRRQGFADIPADMFQRMLDVNLGAVIECTRALLPGMSERKSGHIVNVSSIYAMLGVGQRSAYVTAKFAVRGFTETLRQELRDTGIGVTSVLPGGVKTNITRNSIGWADSEEQRKAARVSEKAAFTSPDKAARKIVRGIRRNKARVLIGPDARFLDWLARWFPVGYHRIVHAILTRGEKRMMNKS